MARLHASKRGFTAIEVLAATALASLLMAVVLGVLAGIAKKERLLEESSLHPAWHDRLIDRLRSDLQNARSLSWNGSSLVLHGATDNFSSHPTWLPIEIQYSTMQVGDHWLLQRTERRSLQSTVASNNEIVCLGVDSLLLATGDIDPQAEPAPVPQGPVPPRVSVLLTFEGGQVLKRSFNVY